MKPKPNKQILVCAGGGADGAPLLRAVSHALRDSSLPFDFDATLVTGPFLDEKTCRELEDIARVDPRIDFRRCERNMASTVAQSDLILAMGGYNSVYEALCMRKRLLIHPRSHPREEQLERAQRLSSLGLVDILTPEQLSSPDTLRNCIVEALEKDVLDARSQGISFSGACEAARRVLQIESTGRRSASAGVR
jgi:predicted glycosyltransferase